jgi:hypothetical protein
VADTVKTEELPTIIELAVGAIVTVAPGSRTCEMVVQPLKISVQPSTKNRRKPNIRGIAIFKRDWPKLRIPRRPASTAC